MNQDIIGQAIGAFLGALFAFISGIGTLIFEKKRERFVLHKNAVVELEYLLNEHLDDLSILVYLAEETNKTLPRQDIYTVNYFHPLRITEQIELKLGDLDLINRYFTYKTSIQRLNKDLTTLNRTNDILKETLLSGTASAESVQKTKTFLIAQIDEVRKYVIKVDREAKTLLCYVRLGIKQNNSWLRKLVNHKMTKLFLLDENSIDDLVQSELQKLDNEIKENA